MFFVCFLMKMCSMMVFFLLQFYLIHFFHFSLTSRSRSCVSSFALVSQRFIQKTIVRLSVCVCVLHLRVLWFSVLFSFFGCVFVTCRVCVVLLQYQIANMVQISQINLICFLLLFFLLKYIMIFSLLLHFCVWLLCII